MNNNIKIIEIVYEARKYYTVKVVEKITIDLDESSELL